jgi:hypothetical protein
MKEPPSGWVVRLIHTRSPNHTEQQALGNRVPLCQGQSSRKDIGPANRAALSRADLGFFFLLNDSNSWINGIQNGIIYMRRKTRTHTHTKYTFTSRRLAETEVSKRALLKTNFIKKAPDRNNLRSGNFSNNIYIETGQTGNTHWTMLLNRGTFSANVDSV